MSGVMSIDVEFRSLNVLAKEQVARLRSLLMLKSDYEVCGSQEAVGWISRRRAPKNQGVMR
jgi:hypothetical protein